MGFQKIRWLDDIPQPYLHIRCRCGHKSVLEMVHVMHFLKTRAPKPMGGRGYTKPTPNDLRRHLKCVICNRRGEVDIDPRPTARR